MMQTLFIAVFLLLLAQPVAAQSPAPAATPAPAPAAAAGTAAALPGTAAKPATAAEPAVAAVADATAVAGVVSAAGTDAGSTPPVPLKEPFGRSLFFTQADLVDIKNAISGISTNGPLGAATEKPIPQVRTIVITGMNYFSDDNWIVWLNGQKVTPYIRPREVQEIDVRPGVVHLKWFDIGANKTLRLSMRPNEVYDIVTGVTLPDQTPVKR